MKVDLVNGMGFMKNYTYKVTFEAHPDISPVKLMNGFIAMETPVNSRHRSKRQQATLKNAFECSRKLVVFKSDFNRNLISFSTDF
jgi:hypothetical protein